MKKRFMSMILIMCMALTLLPGTASAAESFDSFVNRMRSEYDVVISCERSIPLTAEEQGYIETALSAWGKEYVRTISGAFASSKYFGSTETLSSTRMRIIVSNPSGDAEPGLYGKASGEKLYLYGDIWDDVTFHHEFAHMVKHACESASSVNCYGKFAEFIKAANSDAISVSGDYNSAWKPGVDESFYAWSYGKYSPDEDIATIMPNTTDSKWAEKVKNGQMPVITKKLQAFRNYYEKYLTGGSIPCPLIDNILGPSTNRSTEAMGTYFNLITTKMNAGETFKLEIIGSYPITATERFEITSIRSLDPKIIKVDQNTGIITALSEGSTLVSYGFKTATQTSNVGFTLTVTGSVLPTDVRFDFPTTLKVGDKFKPTITLLPEGSIAPAEPRWSYSSNQVITLKDGEVIAQRPGKSTLTCMLDHMDLKVPVEITVEAATVTGITLNETSVTKTTGSTIQLKPTLEPAGSKGTVTYSSSDESVATVNANGLVTTKKAGTAIITAQVGTLSATCTVSVTPAAITGIRLAPAKAGIKVGQTVQLEHTLVPAGTVGAVSYTTSDESVAAVSGTGLVTGKKTGTATITAKSGSFSATSKITVSNIAPTGITLGKATATVEAGKTIQLTAALTPAGAGGTVTYSSSDTGVATVSASGLVTGKKAGAATITAKVGTLTSTCKVTVKSVTLTGITLAPDQAGLKVGQTVQLEHTLMPIGAGGTVSYTSSDTGVATVSSTGLVTGKKAGMATITAKVGTLSATCKITVTAALETAIADGWYNLRVMNNYINISAAGSAELRSKTKNQAFYVESKGGTQVTLKTADGKYLGVSGTVKDGVQLKAVDSPYLWNIYSEKEPDIFSLRPLDKVKMVVNASGQKNVDGTQIILWTHENLDAPNNAEIRFISTQAPGAGTVKHPFTDVPKSAYYENPVIWALNNGVTSGTSATTFAPGETCTRGQVVTFLWRAKGSPEPASTINPFTDVKASDYFYKAVLWAVEKGITSGTSATTFSPNATCTSGQVVTFLWRSNDSPKATSTSSLAAQYSGQYYSDAVAWVDSTGMLAGTGTVFTPNSNSPRADIVTYLYRNAGSPAIQ